MDYVKIFEIIGTGLTLIGIPILSIPRRLGMWILTVATLFWIVFSYANNHNYF